MEYDNEPYNQAELILRYLRKETNATENRKIGVWLAKSQENQIFMERLQSEQGLAEELQFFDGNEKLEAWASIQRNTLQRRSLWPRIAVAASILILLSVGAYYGLKKSDTSADYAHNLKNDIQPGGDKAILTLANGKQIILANTGNGFLAQQGSTRINKTANGQVVYVSAPNIKSNDTSYNTITTPAGGQYAIILPDSSKVYLNASSSLRFPAIFARNLRTVSLTGEAYFEVAHNKNKPFRVLTKGQTVEVLGTHFNINAYNDEKAIKTTLLEGSVRVSAAGQMALLSPGEQSQLAYAGSKSISVIPNADVDEAVAWKNGLFQFNKADIKTVMRQMARWYNVEVVYQGEIKDRVFSGSIYRSLSASKALELLSLTDVHFVIEGKKIIVSE